MWSQQTLQLIESACTEDLGTSGDITSALLPQAGGDVTARVAVREAGVICGLALGPAICAVFSKRLGQELTFTPTVDGKRVRQDGDTVEAASVVATVCGSHAAVLAVERTLLNFLGRMSGVATLTRRFVDAARRSAPAAKILDTRKTIPGWRELDKYAVRASGGHNHRSGLYDAILIKDNHIAGITQEGLATGLTRLLKQKRDVQPAFVEVEVDTLEQLAEVCQVPRRRSDPARQLLARRTAGRGRATRPGWPTRQGRARSQRRRHARHRGRHRRHRRRTHFGRGADPLGNRARRRPGYVGHHHRSGVCTSAKTAAGEVPTAA